MHCWNHERLTKYYTTEEPNGKYMIKKNPAKIPASISYLSLDHIKLDSIINSWLDCRPTAAVPLNLVSWIMPTTLGYFVFSQGIRCLCICKLLKHKNDISYFMVVVFIYYFWYYLFHGLFLLMWNHLDDHRKREKGKTGYLDIRRCWGGSSLIFILQILIVCVALMFRPLPRCK